METSDPRSVCKFKLELLANEPMGSALQDGQQSTDSRSPGRMIPTGVKLKVWDRDRGRCQFPGCGAEDELHFDHILPFSKGGSSTTELNVQLLCARHNLEKSARIE
jgi:5-methylcytosine-specific restriction endonuclease McrA